MEYLVDLTAVVVVKHKGREETVFAMRRISLPFRPLEGDVIFTQWSSVKQEMTLQEVKFDLEHGRFGARVNVRNDWDEINEGYDEEDIGGDNTLEGYVLFSVEELVEDGWNSIMPTLGQAREMRDKAKP